MKRKVTPEELQAPGAVVSDVMAEAVANPPSSPEPPDRPPQPKVQHIGPTYEYEFATYTGANMALKFEELGKRGFRFVGVEPSGKAVFMREYPVIADA